MNLSRNLTLKEATKSNTAERYGIDNQPNEEQLQNLISLAENVFQPCRDYFGKAIYISSGLRSKELNTKINGSFNSLVLSIAEVRHLIWTVIFLEA